jgi:predicted O-methyltransferase YrrM
MAPPHARLFGNNNDMPVLQHLRSARHFYRRIRAQKHLAGLADANVQVSAAIAGAFNSRTSAAEKAWIGHIEELRRRMKACSKVLEITDYSARSADAQLTEEEMYRGRVIRRTIGEVCTRTSRTSRYGLLLLRLIRELKPHTCVELGTSLGISACYHAAALKLNGAGKLVTLEGADAVASVAARNFASLGLDVSVVRGRFQDTLPEVLSANAPVDYAFIDGHHEERATLKYFNAFLPALSGAAVVLFDDIRWSEGMQRAWDAIRRHDRVRLSVDLGSMGLISTAGPITPQHFRTAF